MLSCIMFDHQQSVTALQAQSKVRDGGKHDHSLKHRPKVHFEPDLLTIPYRLRRLELLKVQGRYIRIPHSHVTLPYCTAAQPMLAANLKYPEGKGPSRPRTNLIKSKRIFTGTLFSKTSALSLIFKSSATSTLTYSPTLPLLVLSVQLIRLHFPIPLPLLPLPSSPPFSPSTTLFLLTPSPPTLPYRAQNPSTLPLLQACSARSSVRSFALMILARRIDSASADAWSLMTDSRRVAAMGSSRVTALVR